MKASITRSFPVGYLEITAEFGAITSVRPVSSPDTDCGEDTVDYLICLRAHEQLRQYFSGERKTFDLPLKPMGTQFRLRVWEALSELAYSRTMSYGELAKAIGSPKSCRAVGGAIHNNPIYIIIPCHRVIGADGSLTGYGGGLEMKEYLLKLEQKFADSPFK